ncbi:DIS3-like exonuclease 2 [Dichanthelium oligosanthes]|uniref:DIS3-like exonuclease 2 n=1 Tax=Dichanthelium oligosanthes TaxID=888268 RepID=A0A1E5VC10_9POAL|nr:DIS3-like exonuclease 2 [Dichanthelium oligosanthes]
MRATGEHTAAVPIPAPPPPPPPSAADEAEKEKRKNRRRQTRRSKQAGTAPAAAPQGPHADAAGPRSVRSMPPMHVGGGARADAEAEAYAAGTSQSCPLLPTPGPVEALVARAGAGAPGRRYFQPHWPERAVEEAVKAYCTIDGIPVDILITGLAQNRAVEGDLVAITLDPVLHWTRMKGLNVACNPAIGGDLVREIGETNGNHSRKKGQADAGCRFENCSNGVPVLDRTHLHHKNSGFSQAVKCENGNATVPESNERDLNDEKSEAARALKRICTMIYSHPGRRPTGKVLSVMKKSPRRDAIVGFLASFPDFPDGEQQKNQMGVKRMSNRAQSVITGLIHLLPTDPKFPRMVVSVSTLPDSVRQSLREGDAAIEKELVAARLDDWNEESFYPYAHVVRFLGKGGHVKTHMDAILFENAISDAEFSPESLACLPDNCWKIPQKEIEARKDLRKVLTFTIDPPTASDLDDAISIEILPGGTVRIGVHIADVSYFVHPETALDAEAQSRSTSVYTLRRKISMLPSRLSEELVSLNPGVDRLAFSIIWDIDPHGNIVSRWIGRSIIFSCCKLSYDLVQHLICSDASQSGSAVSSLQVHGIFERDDILKSLRGLYEVSKNLKEIRFKGGALSLDTAKLMILFDEDGAPCDSYRYVRNDACFIVEELMLLANMTAAEVISNAFPDCALLRRHPEPNLRKFREFEAFCAKNGFELDASSSGQLHLSLSMIKEKLQDDPVLFDILMFYASKQMQSAEYFCTGDLIGKKDDWAHYALAVPLYTHFTSPLRRYPDIIVHRTLNAVIEAEQMYMKQKKSSTGRNGVKTSCELMDRCDRCFTGLQFSKDAAESEEGKKALSTSAKKFKVPSSENLGEVAEHCNERKWAGRRAEEAGQKLYMWSLIKNKEIVVCNARVLGLGARFMSVYVPKLAMERRIYYDEVEGLSVEWLEATGTLVLDACRNKPAQRRGTQMKSRSMEEVAMVVNPSELMLSEEDEESGATEAGGCTAKSVLLSGDAVKAEVAPAVLPLVIHYLSDIPVVLHATGGEDSAVDIGVRLYMASYFK